MAFELDYYNRPFLTREEIRRIFLVVKTEKERRECPSWGWTNERYVIDMRDPDAVVASLKSSIGNGLIVDSSVFDPPAFSLETMIMARAPLDYKLRSCFANYCRFNSSIIPVVEDNRLKITADTQKELSSLFKVVADKLSSYEKILYDCQSPFADIGLAADMRESTLQLREAVAQKLPYEQNREFCRIYNWKGKLENWHKQIDTDPLIFEGFKKCSFVDKGSVSVVLALTADKVEPGIGLATRDRAQMRLLENISCRAGLITRGVDYSSEQFYSRTFSKSA